MDQMLEHYENECTFHTVECLRCGGGVQHRDLPTHYVVGCNGGVSSGITACPSSERTALSLEDVNAALEDLKAMLGDANHDRLLPEIQSQLNELKAQVRSQETLFAAITREIGACERNLKGDMAQMAATISSTASRLLTFSRNVAEESSMLSSLSLRSEKALILRKLERLADLEHSREASPQSDSSRVIAHCRISHGGAPHLHSALSTTPAWIKKIGNVTYDVTLENCEEIIQYQGLKKKFAEVMVWHMRDTYFTVAVVKCWAIPAPVLTVKIEFNGMLENSRCWPPFWQVRVCGNATKKHRSLTSRAMPCFCDRYDDSLQHFHLEFQISIPSLKKDDFVRDGKITLEILLNDREMDGGVRGGS